MGTVDVTQNGLVNKTLFTKTQQYIGQVAAGWLLKIPYVHSVTVDVFFTSNTLGAARFSFFKENNGNLRCFKIFGKSNYNMDSTTKAFHDSENNYYLQFNPNVGWYCKVVGSDTLNGALEIIKEYDESVLTEIPITF